MTEPDPTRVPGLLEGIWWAWRRGGLGGGLSRGQLVARTVRATITDARALKRWMQVVCELKSRGIVTDVPGEYLRAVRPYVNRHTGYSERVLQLIEHVDWLETALKADQLERLLAGQPVVLAELPPPKGYDYLRLQLENAPDQIAEGELLLTLTLQRAADEGHQAVPVQVAALGFSRFRQDGLACLVIGGVRGQRDPVHRVSVVEMSRAMAGWKPSVLMVRVAQELASAWHLQLIGLDPSSHRLQGWTSLTNQRQRETARRIYKSYDALWDYFGARKGPLGWVVLPLDSDEKLAATALSPEKREQQTRRADFWIRTRKVLRKEIRAVLRRPDKEPRLSRNTQSLHPPEWERSDHGGMAQREEDMVPSSLIDTRRG